MLRSPLLPVVGGTSRSCLGLQVVAEQMINKRRERGEREGDR